jgi:hypothetical protein
MEVPYMSVRGTVMIDGTEVYVYRSQIDGYIVIDVESGEGLDTDHHGDDKSGAPKLRIFVNSELSRTETDPDTGEWIKKEGQ